MTSSAGFAARRNGLPAALLNYCQSGVQARLEYFQRLDVPLK